MSNIVGMSNDGLYENPLWVGNSKESMKDLLAKNEKIKKYLKDNNIIEYNDDDLNMICDTYINTCVEKSITPTPAGLAVALGTNSPVLMMALKKDDSRGDILRNAMEKINAMYQQGVIESRVPTKAYEIVGKNYFGISDISKQEVVINDTRVDEREVAKHIEQLMSRRELLLDNDD